jgi:hypothetical protein
MGRIRTLAAITAELISQASQPQRSQESAAKRQQRDGRPHSARMPVADAQRADEHCRMPGVLRH